MKYKLRKLRLFSSDIVANYLISKHWLGSLISGPEHWKSWSSRFNSDIFDMK